MLAILQACHALSPQALAGLQDSLSKATVKQEEADPLSAAEPRPDEPDNRGLEISGTVCICKGNEPGVSAAEADCRGEEEVDDRADAICTSDERQHALGVV